MTRSILAPLVAALQCTAATFALSPATARAQISVESTVEEHRAQAGERYSGTIRLRNSGTRPEEAKLYLADYQFFADGRTVFAPPGSTARSNARWVTVPTRVTVPARGEVALPYTVAVPRDSGAARTGTWWSTLMVEGISAGSAESSLPVARQARAAVGMQTKTRYAIQLATHLDEGERRANFTDPRVAQTPAGKALTLDIANTGTAGYRLKLALELYDAQGRLAGRLEQQRGLIYPGTSIRSRFDLPRLPAGEYRALLVADTGTEDVFGAQYRLRL